MNSVYSPIHSPILTIEIVNKTRGGIEGKIGTALFLGGGANSSCFRRIFLLFKLFYRVAV